MTKRALVLGGGGSIGIAWETGVAAGLADEGIDLRLADKIVGTTTLARGVASSCSVPGLFPPITINGRRYIDGGMRSATNFDLAEGFERVIAVAVIPPGGAAFMGARIDPELAHLRRAGSHVELITPDAASLDVFGPNLMDASRQAAALDAGVKQGRAEAVRIRSVWA